jgi:hypothetical protein
MEEEEEVLEVIRVKDLKEGEEKTQLDISKDILIRDL